LERSNANAVPPCLWFEIKTKTGVVDRSGDVLNYLIMKDLTVDSAKTEYEKQNNYPHRSQCIMCVNFAQISSGDKDEAIAACR